MGIDTPHESPIEDYSLFRSEEKSRAEAMTDDELLAAEKVAFEAVERTERTGESNRAHIVLEALHEELRTRKIQGVWSL